MKRAQMSIGRLAASAGVHLETVRYYERIGVMPVPERTEGGHRAYTPEHRARLEFIRRARELGFGLDQVRALIALSEPGRQACAEVKALAAAHLAEVRVKIADLTRLEAVLDATVNRCGDGAAPGCPVIDVLSGGEAAA
jgi:MerR family mercuric resistance operon transcriptional regulator